MIVRMMSAAPACDVKDHVHEPGFSVSVNPMPLFRTLPAREVAGTGLDKQGPLVTLDGISADR